MFKWLSIPELGHVPQKGTLWHNGAGFFYSMDALPVTQPMVSKNHKVIL